MKNPHINALLAGAYIGVIVVAINTVSRMAELEETLFIPMAMLSLFVLSAAVMGFLFIYHPATLFLEGKKNEALSHFSKTVGTFALIVAAYVLLLMLL